VVILFPEMLKRKWIALLAVLLVRMILVKVWELLMKIIRTIREEEQFKHPAKGAFFFFHLPSKTHIPYEEKGTLAGRV
jgi:hypothetical protein